MAKQKLINYLQDNTYNFKIMGEDKSGDKTTYAIIEYTPTGSKSYYFLYTIGDQIFNDEGTNLEEFDKLLGI